MSEQKPNPEKEAVAMRYAQDVQQGLIRPDPRDAQIAALSQRVAALEKDAERYRWLRGAVVLRLEDNGEHRWYFPRLLASEPRGSLDAAIDACCSHADAESPK